MTAKITMEIWDQANGNKRNLGSDENNIFLKNIIYHRLKSETYDFIFFR